MASAHRRDIGGLLGLALLGGCWAIPAQQKFQRTEEMVDHQEDLTLARDAIRAGDLEGARQAGAHLARPDWFPGAGPEGKEGIEAVRRDAQGLAQAHSLEDAATALVGLTARCAACHAGTDTPAPEAWTDDAPEPLWIGLAFESEEAWKRGLEAQPNLPADGDWRARRKAMAAALVGAGD